VRPKSVLRRWSITRVSPPASVSATGTGTALPANGTNPIETEAAAQETLVSQRVEAKYAPFWPGDSAAPGR
jgi:hypothetical protein